MLVNLEEKMVKKLKVGTEHVITGLFADQSEDGFVRSSGLLIHESMESVKDREKSRNESN